MIKLVDSDPRISDLERRIDQLIQENDDLGLKLFQAQKQIPACIKPDDFVDDDSTFNFRLNAALKQKFSDICKREHLTVGIALKRYMTDCVVAGVLK